MFLVLLRVYGHHEVQVLDERRYRFAPSISTLLLTTLSLFVNDFLHLDLRRL